MPVSTVTAIVGVPRPLQVSLVPAIQVTVMVAVPVFTGVTVNVADVSGGVVYCTTIGLTLTASPFTLIEMVVVQFVSLDEFASLNVASGPGYFSDSRVSDNS